MQTFSPKSYQKILSFYTGYTNRRFGHTLLLFRHFTDSRKKMASFHFLVGILLCEHKRRYMCQKLQKNLQISVKTPSKLA